MDKKAKAFKSFTGIHKHGLLSDSEIHKIIDHWEWANIVFPSNWSMVWNGSGEI